MERKNFLKTFALMAAAGPMIIDGCKKDATTKTSSTTVTSSSTSSTSTSDTSASCIVTADEVEGPYPYVGGESTNPLDRSDVTAGQTGVPLTLSFLVVDAGNSCNVVSNARVDIWHCNKDGYYSGYANQNSSLGNKSYVGETWLRGYQLTDSTGVAKFTTIYPGWYSGRATHIHIEVYVSGVMKKTTQICFSESINGVVYASSLYSTHGVNPITNEADSIFGNSLTDLANETVALTGSVSEGYSGSYTIGIKL